MKRSRKSALEKDGDISMATRYQVGGEVEEELDVHVHDAGDVFGAFDITRHPVEGVGNAA